jgi:hypothetical protein
VNSVDPDITAGIYELFCIYSVRICDKTCIHKVRDIWKCNMHIRNRHTRKTQPSHAAKKKRGKESIFLSEYQVHYPTLWSIIIYTVCWHDLLIFLQLKTSLLSEVKSEICDTQNTKMLQLQLQAREAEIRRLKMELLLQNVGTGRTRKIQTLESDVW